MEMTKIFFVAMCFVTPSVVTGITNSSLARSSISHTEILVRLLIVPRVKNVTVQMKTLYPFITSSDYFYEPLITLGLDLNKDCINQQTRADKLGTLLSQMAVFMAPLNFAFLYEHAQGAASHNRLASVLELTSFFLNDTVSYIRRQLRDKGFSVPDYPIIPEAKLNELTRVYLNTLVQKNLVTLTITNDVMKRYRNYVIIYMLRDVVKEIDPCF
ncbi:hypothetical protein OS493_012205 [Desmophyllum pertusum]|uniref:Uncharacterized protein n=1 Tax=Desmophyllum pertusum TaxID=174260 RepID=A0A9X0DC13_9CNID|nr:hypothetical protein OS493_012205 [Desmophyllum pertusum]